MASNNYMTQRKGANRWQDWTNLTLAVWLFLSPWILQSTPGFGAGISATALAAAAWNAWIFGAIIGVLAAVALVGAQPWEEWTNLVIGLWLAVSPWVLGFAGDAAALSNAVIVGVLVLLLAAWELYDISQPASARAADPH